MTEIKRKKIIAVNAGPRMGWNTETLITEASKGAEQAGVFGRDAEGNLAGIALGHAWGTYLHGIFDSDAFRRAFLDHVRTSLGKKPQGRILVSCDVERGLARLASAVRASVDMEAIYAMLGLGRPR